MTYQQRIKEILDQNRVVGVDPRHVEAWMRAESGTLDGLSLRKFRAEVSVCVDVARQDAATSEQLAKSYGL